jgi:hypothetical protein
MTATISETDAAWAAGFLDGEAYLGIRRHRRDQYLNHSLVVSVDQNVVDPLDKLQSLFGGAVWRGRGIWRWSATTKNAFKALESTLPYLTVKKEQAEVAIGFQQRRQAGSGAADKDLDERDRLRMMEIRASQKAITRCGASAEAFSNLCASGSPGEMGVEVPNDAVPRTDAAG